MIKREQYLTKIRPFYNSDLVKVLIGMRRSGKSVLLKQIISELKEQGVEESHIIYLNFEDLDYSFIRNEMDLHRYIKDKTSDQDKYYLFFDEIQNVMNFEKAVNSFRSSLNCSIFITGSNGKLLSGELATHLSGRYVSFRIMPFSFAETCKVRGLSKSEIQESHFMDYLDYGGMPQRFLMQTEEETRVYLRDLYNSIVLRDIMQRSNVRDLDALNRIMEYLVLNVSQLFSAKAISDFFKNGGRSISTETIYQYLDLILSSMVLNRATRYDIQGKRILTRSDKYYLTDLGFSKIKRSGFKADLGPRIENIVYNELINRGYDVYVGKTQTGEIDFITMEGGQRAYYQVTYLLADESVADREFGAFHTIVDHYPKMVLSMDKYDFSRGGITHRNIMDFLLEDHQ